MRDRPIGYWVKTLDRLIERSFEDAIGNASLSRRHWQALNVIHDEKLVSRSGLDQVLAPFLEVGVTTRPVVDDLLGRGWLSEDAAGRLALTETGTARLAALRETVTAVRRRTTEGVTDAEYQTTVETLSRMCANLQPQDVC